MEVVGTVGPVTPDEVGLGTQRHSVSLSGAVAPIAPKPPGVRPAGEGVLGVGGSLLRTRSGQTIRQLARGARRPPLERPAGQNQCCTSVAVYVGSSTEQTVASNSTSGLDSICAHTWPFLCSGKRHCGVGGGSGGGRAPWTRRLPFRMLKFPVSSWSHSFQIRAIAVFSESWVVLTFCINSTRAYAPGGGPGLNA